MDGPERVLVGSAEQAGEVALAYIRNEWRPDYEPAIVHVEDAGAAWRVFYNDRKYLETKSLGHTLIENWPLRVVKVSAVVEWDELYRQRTVQRHE